MVFYQRSVGMLELDLACCLGYILALYMHVVRIGVTCLFLFKILEDSIDVVFHGYINVILVLVPVEVETAV